MMHKTIVVEGSHGHLIVHAATGVILERTTCDCGECSPTRAFPGYSSILFFDPFGWDPIALEHGETDILYASYWDHAGYARAMSTATSQGPRDREPWMYADEVHLLEDMRPDVERWADYARRLGVAEAVIEYVKKGPCHG